MVAGRWRAALAAAPRTRVVANADDPLVVWGAGAATDVHWVGAGLRWQLDAVGCPSCEGRIEFGEGAWACRDCGFARPSVEVSLEPGPEPEPGGEGGGAGMSVSVSVSVPRRRCGPTGGVTRSASSCRDASTRRTRCWPRWRRRRAASTGGGCDAMAEVAEVAGRFTVRAFGETRRA